MKKFNILMIFIAITLIVVGCSNGNNDGNDTSNDKDGSTNQTDDSKRNQGTMKLGEAGLIHDAVGKFEITPNSVEVFSERDEITPHIDDSFVLVNFTITNVSDDPIEGDQTLGTRLILENKEGRKSDEKSDPVNGFDFVDRLDKVVEPGESHDAQMIFEIDATDEYTLHYGSGSGSIEDAEWKFTKEEIDVE